MNLFLRAAQGLALLSLTCAHAHIRGDHSAALHRMLMTQTAWNQIGQDLDGQAANDQSGWALAVSETGNRVVVASPLNDAGGTDAGSVRVFEFRSTANGGAWLPLGAPILGTVGAGFGMSVAISGMGDTIAVGSTRAFPYTGKVQVYKFQSNNWVLQATLDSNNDQNGNDRFGDSVSLSYDGTRLAVGAPFHPFQNMAAGPGATFVFDLTAPTSWDQIGEVTGGVNGEKSGYSVSLSGDGSTVAVGEIDASPTSALSKAGTTAVYRMSSSLSGWEKLGSDIPGMAAGEQSGFSVDISEDGSVVAVGSPYYSTPQAVESGMVRVFKYDSSQNSWVQLGSNIYPTSPAAKTKFGYSVSLSSDGLILAVGEPTETGAGKASIYYYSFSSWSRDITLPARAATDWFGSAVALSGQGTRLAAGAHFADQAGANSGQTRVYEFQTSGWTLEVENFVASFGSGVGNEINVTFAGIAPDVQSGRTFRTTMLLSTCKFGEATSPAITPLNPVGQVEQTGEAFKVTSKLNVNTNTIKTSGFYSDGASTGTGMISFCLKMEVLQGTEVKAERLADIIIDLDMGQDFFVTDFISRDPTTGKTDVRDRTQFQYGYNHFFCDENKQAISGSSGKSVPPGGKVSVCLKANNGEPVAVTNVKSASFENSLAPLLGVPLIDGSGRTLEATTIKDCLNGVCRVEAITVPRMYEYVDSSGTVKDVTAGVSMAGVVTFAFPGRRLNDEEATLETSFRVKLDLATPPSRASDRESSGAVSRGSFVVAALSGMLCLF